MIIYINIYIYMYILLIYDKIRLVYDVNTYMLKLGFLMNISRAEDQLTTEDRYGSKFESGFVRPTTQGVLQGVSRGITS